MQMLNSALEGFHISESGNSSDELALSSTPLGHALNGQAIWEGEGRGIRLDHDGGRRRHAPNPRDRPTNTLGNDLGPGIGRAVDFDCRLLVNGVRCRGRCRRYPAPNRY